MKPTTHTIRTALRTWSVPALLGLLVAASMGPAGAQSTSGSEALKAATQLANGIRAATGAKPVQTKFPPGDPCTILPLAEVQKVFPGARAGERSRRLEEYGSTECGWKGPDGQVVIAAQESYTGGDAKEEVRGMAQGFTDPLKAQSLRNVRVETFPGLGSDAAAVVETADPKRGILGDGAILIVTRAKHSVMLLSAELPHRDRAAALKALDELGRSAAKRLQ